MDEHIEGHIFPAVIVVLIIGNFLLKFHTVLDLRLARRAALTGKLARPFLIIMLFVNIFVFFLTSLTNLLVLVPFAIATFEKRAAFDIAPVPDLVDIAAYFRQCCRYFFLAWLTASD